MCELGSQFAQLGSQHQVGRAFRLTLLGSLGDRFELRGQGAARLLVPTGEGLGDGDLGLLFDLGDLLLARLSQQE